MINPIDIGNRVRYNRNRIGITQEELAERANLSRVHISYLECGERLPSLEGLISIANALGVSSDELLGESLIAAEHGMDGEINILKDCSPEEINILLRNMSSLKDILRGYKVRADK